VKSIANAVKISSEAVPMSGSAKIGTAKRTTATSSVGATPFESERTCSPSDESLAARNSTSASLAISEGWNENARRPSQRRAPPETKPTCGISVTTSRIAVATTSPGAIVLSLR